MFRKMRIFQVQVGGGRYFFLQKAEGACRNVGFVLARRSLENALLNLLTKSRYRTTELITTN